MSAVKNASKNTFLILILAALVATLFMVVEVLDYDALMVYLQFFIFPGLLFVVLAGLSIDWFDRFLYARMQNRVGPPFLQPVYDLLKLLAKEDITPDGVDNPEYDLIPPFQVFIAILSALFVPVVALNFNGVTRYGLISFEGDLFFLVFLLATIGGSIFFLGWASNNPYGLIGGSRAAIAEFSFEIPFALALTGPALLAGSFQISKMTESNYTLLSLPLAVMNGDLEAIELVYLLPLLLLFFIAVLSSTALLEKVPFDPAHAEVEIVGGWAVELTGKKLAFTRVANLIMEFVIAGLIAGIFLGCPEMGFNLKFMLGDINALLVLLETLLFIVKTCFVVFLITLMRTLHSRIRIDQMVGVFWKYFLPLALFGVFSIVVLIGVL